MRLANFDTCSVLNRTFVFYDTALFLKATNNVYVFLIAYFDVFTDYYEILLHISLLDISTDFYYRGIYILKQSGVEIVLPTNIPSKL